MATPFGRRIAQEIRFPGTTAVAPLYGLGELPNGLRVCAFEVAEERTTALRPRDAATSYDLGAGCSTRPPIVVNMDDPNAPITRGGPPQPVTPGEPVQGRETVYLESNGYRQLWVLNAVNGTAVRVAGEVPPADLYAVAERLILPA
ncbi:MULTISPECIES: hypothetical protein [Saccharothrix]|uniref:hypothetical protein n=1 Tax=Saccharothrix TaxID=2071 RepID=UPI00093B2413|nr:hypothetical protein [Saccharothrix sp. CB00851]OKI36621.1 hypothetical protein A6A25_21370 [Saccharothrix sp. CB00851]